MIFSMQNFCLEKPIGIALRCLECDFKQYCLLSEVFYILYYISMQDFCFEKPIGIALSCFDSVLSNITCFLVQLFTNSP